MHSWDLDGGNGIELGDGTNVTISGEGGGVVLDAKGAGRHFDVRGALALEGLTLSNGKGPDVSGSEGGCGVVWWYGAGAGG